MILLHQSGMRDEDPTKCEMDFDGYKSKPEIRLLAAMFARAIQDASGNVGSLTPSEVKQHKREALQWLLESPADTAGEFSCPWVCNWLNLDYSIVRRRVQEVLAIGKPMFLEGKKGMTTRLKAT